MFLIYNYLKYTKVVNPQFLEAGTCKLGPQLTIIFIINESINYFFSEFLGLQKIVKKNARHNFPEV